VSGQIFPIDEEVVVLVQFPELAVDDVKVFVAEEVRNLVDVFLLQKMNFNELTFFFLLSDLHLKTIKSLLFIADKKSYASALQLSYKV
jgi:hypothetical protein